MVWGFLKFILRAVLFLFLLFFAVAFCSQQMDIAAHKNAGGIFGGRLEVIETFGSDYSPMLFGIGMDPTCACEVVRYSEATAIRLNIEGVKAVLGDSFGPTPTQGRALRTFGCIRYRKPELAKILRDASLSKGSWMSQWGDRIVVPEKRIAAGLGFCRSN